MEVVKFLLVNVMKVKILGEKYLSSGKAAKILGINQETLRLWEKSGKLCPHHKSESGYKYYTEKQLYDFLESFYGKYDEVKSLEVNDSASEEADDAVEESNKILSSEDMEVEVLPPETVAESEERERERQGKGIVAKYHYFSTSRLVRSLKEIYLNEFVKVPLGKTGYVDVMMWLDRNMQMEIMPTAFDTPEEELKPTEFDLFIIESVYSLKKAGNKEFTAAQLIKHMHGNSAGGISDEEIQYAEDRLRTMMTWFIRIEVTEEFRHYPKLPEDMKNIQAIQGHLLDTVILERKDADGKTRISFGFPINGCFGIPDDKNVAVILEAYSESIKQLTCFPTALLDIPQIRMSRSIRILTNYLVKQIQGLKGNKKGINSLKFETIERDLGMTGYPVKKLARMRNCMVTIIQSCKEKGQIKDYEVLYEGKKISGVKFEWEGVRKKKDARIGIGRGNKVHTRKSASVPDTNG